MSAVNLWKPLKLPSCTCLKKLRCKWQFVSISENSAPTDRSVTKFEISSTQFNIFSVPYSSFLHRA